MDLDYFVLNVKPVRRADPFRGGTYRGGVVMGGTLGMPVDIPQAGHSAITVETTKLSETQAREAKRDPSNTVAPVMPVALIKPAEPADYAMASLVDAVAVAQAAKGSWGIGATGADTSDLTGEGVVVAILDTGIDREHTAFAGVDLETRKNFSGGDSADVDDRHGHGTHCAGTAFGRDVNGTRIGVARGVQKAIIGKVLDDQGRGSTAAVLKALHWAAGEGANVVSLSLGFDFPGMAEQLRQADRPEKLAVSMALKAYRDNLRMFDALLTFLMLENPASPGLVVVAASGNESMRNLDPNFVIDTSLPAAASANILSVGAIQRNGDLFGIAPFSNVNPVLSAPGVDIVSAKSGGGLVALSGTSMACPHVAGLAALYWQQAARAGVATGNVVRGRLIAGAQAVGFPETVGPVDRGVGMARVP
jgi:subtilisin family serine protease